MLRPEGNEDALGLLSESNRRWAASAGAQRRDMDAFREHSQGCARIAQEAKERGAAE